MDAEELAIIALIMALALVAYEDANGHMNNDGTFMQVPGRSAEKASIREISPVPPRQRD